MERDFMGLSLKEPFAMVKDEVNSDGCKEIGFAIGSGMQWPFSNKVSALPHLMSFKVVPGDKTKRMVSDPLISSGFMSITTPDAYNPSQKLPMAEIQKTFNRDTHVETHLSLTPYQMHPRQHDVNSVHHPPHDAKMLPASNNATSISLSNSFFKNQHAIAGQNMVGAMMKPQFLGGFPVTAPLHSVLPTASSTTGITDPCVKASACPAQLTIFYAGAVNVYDDISPEKAQTIMFLAGNGPSMSSNLTQSKVQVHVPGSKPATLDINPLNQPITTPPCSHLLSPLSVSSHTGAQSGSGSTSTEEIVTAKTAGVPTTPMSKLKPPKTTTAMGSVTATTMIPSAVPQARKASLARFLEKRKERFMSAAPYNLNEKSPCVIK